MPASPPEALAVDVRAARRRFGRAYARGHRDDFLAAEIRTRMAERLALVRYVPKRILDAGSGRGLALPLLRARYPQSEIVALDQVEQALAEIAPKASLGRRLRRLVGRTDAATYAVGGDIAALPFAQSTFGCIWSNLAINWAGDWPATFAEWARVLEPGGMVFFSGYGPDTARELRETLARTGERLRAHAFVDMHDIGDMLVAAGFGQPVMDVERLTVTYPSFDALIAELRAAGQTNTLAARSRAPFTRALRQRIEAQYPRDGAGRLPLTIEVVYGHAWRAEPRHVSDGRAIVRFERKPR